MNNTDSLLKRVRCSIHHGEQPNYLSIDPKSFQIICSLCAKEGLKSKKKNLIIVDPELKNAEEMKEKNNIIMPDKEESNRFCFEHKNEPSLFYCKECAILFVKHVLQLSIETIQVQLLI
jgi:glucose-6-phosphate 1-dehydrogenase